MAKPTVFYRFGRRETIYVLSPVRPSPQRRNVRRPNRNVKFELQRVRSVPHIAGMSVAGQMGSKEALWLMS